MLAVRDRHIGRVARTGFVEHESQSSKDIAYLSLDLSFGQALVSVTAKGITSLSICGDKRGTKAIPFKSGSKRPVPRRIAKIIKLIEQRLDADLDLTGLPLEIHGTPFQRAVWRRLQKIPRGQTVTYAEVAQAIGRPRAVRAVANACACNAIALAIPCHRVVRSDGTLGGYRWGVALKRRLLAIEAA